MATVYEQLNELDGTLCDYIDNHIVDHMNRGFWEETEHPDAMSVRALQDIVDWSFDPLFTRYRYAPGVMDLLKEWHEKLSDILWISVNGPYPRNLELFSERLMMNTSDLFFDKYFDKLYDAMVEENHNVHVVQRCWKRAISDPNYVACDRRLRKEANELKELACM
jgi:hypothetical protein